MSQPGATWPPELVTPQAPRDGWQERLNFEYETSPAERCSVRAAARRSGTYWTVVIISASDATGEKRGTRIGLVLASLRPPGYQRESFASERANPLDAARIAAMRAFVEEGMCQLDIPGVGWRLIDGGRIVFVGGSGVRELGKPEPVDADTLFIAASNTRALTALLLAELVDEKKRRWDQPVVEAHPAFRHRRCADDAAGARQAPRPCLHRHAGAGHGGDVRVHGRCCCAMRSTTVRTSSGSRRRLCGAQGAGMNIESLAVSSTTERSGPTSLLRTSSTGTPTMLSRC